MKVSQCFKSISRGKMHLPSLVIFAFVCYTISLLISAVTSWVIPTEAVGEVLIPVLIQASGMSIFRLGKMIGAKGATNHGIHGGPVHHVFPVVHKNPPPPAYEDEDENDHRQPVHHKYVVDSHYSEGRHVHHLSWN